MKQERYPYIGNPYGFILPQRKEVIHPVIKQWDDFTENDKAILQNIKNVIFSIIGECRICAFGSRVKGNWDENSDYDVVVTSIPNYDIQHKIKTHDYGHRVDVFFRNSDNNKFDAEVEIL